MLFCSVGSEKLFCRSELGLKMVLTFLSFRVIGTVGYVYLLFVLVVIGVRLWMVMTALAMTRSRVRSFGTNGSSRHTIPYTIANYASPNTNTCKMNICSTTE